MYSDYGTHYLVRLKDRGLYSFFADNKGNICYSNLLEDEMPVVVLSQAKKEFGLCNDSYGGLHLICLSHRGEIIYIHHNGQEWPGHILAQYNPEKYMIRFPAIFELDSEIHIIIALGYRHDKNRWQLYHYRWNGNKWDNQRIAEFYLNTEPSPFRYDIYDRDIYLIYHGILNDSLVLFHMKYDGGLKEWSLSPKEGDLERKVEVVAQLESDMVEELLDWSNKVKIAYENHLSLSRETDELRRRAMESKRQWELMMDELKLLEEAIAKSGNKGGLRGFLESKLHKAPKD